MATAAVVVARAEGMAVATEAVTGAAVAEGMEWGKAAAMAAQAAAAMVVARTAVRVVPLVAVRVVSAVRLMVEVGQGGVDGVAVLLATVM